MILLWSKESVAAAVAAPATDVGQPTLSDADDFVQNAADVFGGKLVKVENIGAVNVDIEQT